MADKTAETMTEQVHDIDVNDGKMEAVVGVSSVLKNFENRQHSLTRLQAFKENWKALIWCKSDSFYHIGSSTSPLTYQQACTRSSSVPCLDSTPWLAAS
jgi:hypothetical protein